MAAPLAVYARGLRAYRLRQWDAAIGYFNEVLRLLPEDGPSLSMLTRCEGMRRTPPGGDWSGVFVIGHK